jgi:hypothetical protein
MKFSFMRYFRRMGNYTVAPERILYFLFDFGNK